MQKIVFAFLLLLVTSKTVAQDSIAQCNSNCSCGYERALPAGLMFGHTHAKGEWMFSYRYMNMYQKDFKYGANDVATHDLLDKYPSAHQSMLMNMHMVMAMYGLNDRVTLMVNQNCASAVMNVSYSGDDGHANHEHAATHSSFVNYALGDAEVHVLFAPFKSSVHEWVLNAGVSLPIGTAPTAFDYNMHSGGSGSFEMLPGLTYLFSPGKWQWGVQATARFLVNNNKNDFRMGNRYAATSWCSYQMLRYLNVSLRAEYTQTEENSLKNFTHIPITSMGFMSYGSASVKFNALFGITWQPFTGIFKQWQLGVEGGATAYSFYSGTQNAQKMQLNANLNYLF